MAEITASLVKELREKTGAGMVNCKKALTETDGDFDKAIDYLRKKGLDDAAKKSSRIAADGLITVCKSDDNKIATILEVNSETDFVAKTDDFIGLCDDISNLILTKKPSDIDALNKLPFEKYNSTVGTVVSEKIGTIGENIILRRFSRLESTNGIVDAYIHMGGKMGAIVEMENVTIADIPMIKDIALHICAMNPLCVSPSELDQDLLKHEEEIYTAKAKESGKPDNIISKIVEGQIKKFTEESCLLSQNFVKNPDITIKDFLGDKKVIRFTRFMLGDGIERRKDDFAEEVKKQAGL